jgi:hypothetical protein
MAMVAEIMTAPVMGWRRDGPPIFSIALVVGRARDHQEERRVDDERGRLSPTGQDLRFANRFEWDGIVHRGVRALLHVSQNNLRCIDFHLTLRDRY